MFTPTESNGVAYIDVADGSSINDALAFLENYVATNASVSAGVVNVTSSTQFSETLVGQNNVRLNIEDGVTLTLNAALAGPAYDLSGTSYSGLTGSGTFAINGNAQYGVYGSGADNVVLGNVDAAGATPPSLTITGWQYGVAIESTATVAAHDITIENLEIVDPQSANVEFPLLISNRPGLNGLWVEDVIIDGLLVDGGHPTAPGGEKVGGEHSADNQYTADQITLQGVHGATLTNITSLNGGENGLTISWGSRDITITDSTTTGADAHGFNIGSGGYALDVASTAGLTAGMQIVGDSSGTTAEIIGVYSGRIWIKDAAVDRFDAGEQLTVVGGGPSTTITAAHRTENVTLERVTSYNNGLSVGDDHDGSGDPILFADIYLQQAENVFVSGTVGSLGRISGSGERIPHYGVYVGNASYTLGDMIYQLYGDQQVPVGEFADVVRHAPTSSQSSIISGTTGDDVITGTYLADVITGGAGADSLNGGTGDDQLDGGDGNDELIGHDGADTVNGGAGNDIIFGGTGADILNGDDGNDDIHGGDGNDQITGGIGDDVINGGLGTDTISGDAGQDTISGGDGNDVIFAGNDDDTVNGNSGRDTIYGGLGHDQLFGNEDDDVIFGGDGNDIISGGTGRDRIWGDVGDDSIDGQDGADTIQGGDGNDTLTGGADVDRLYGQLGDDTLYGNDGNDILFGGGGIDILVGGEGNDLINGNTENDDIDGNGGNDTIFGGGNDDDINGGDGNDRLYGQAGNDVVQGSTGDDYVNGGGGDDILYGSEGADRLIGSAGNDQLIGGNGADNLHGGSGDDILNGNGDDDILNGFHGNDELYGGGGDDVLRGGRDDDLLTGQTGTDRFVFDNDWGHDTIRDFASDGLEKIDLRNVTGIDSIDDLTITNVAGAVLIEYDGNSITLNALTTAHIDASDFFF